MANNLAVERRIVRHLIRTARAAGYQPLRVYDGGDFPVATPSEASMLDAIFAVDDSTIVFKHPAEPKGHCAVIVLGNGADCVVDASVGARWDVVVAANAEYAEQLEGALL